MNCNKFIKVQFINRTAKNEKISNEVFRKPRNLNNKLFPILAENLTYNQYNNQ